MRDFNSFIGLYGPTIGIMVTLIGFATRGFTAVRARFDSIDASLAKGREGQNAIKAAQTSMKARIDLIDAQVNHASEGEQTLREMVYETNERVARLEERTSAG